MVVNLSSNWLLVFNAGPVYNVAKPNSKTKSGTGVSLTAFCILGRLRCRLLFEKGAWVDLNYHPAAMTHFRSCHSDRSAIELHAP